VQKIETNSDCERVIAFLLEQFRTYNISSTEQNDIREGVYESIADNQSSYWFATDGDEVVGAFGVAPNWLRNGGYEAGWFAVSEQHRRKGVGSDLLAKAEEFIQSRNGRFLLIDTGATDAFRVARAFYQANGYTAVSRIPDYWGEGEDKIDYYKSL